MRRINPARLTSVSSVSSVVESSYVTATPSPRRVLPVLLHVNFCARGYVIEG
jgi:hypothetical protein